MNRARPLPIRMRRLVRRIGWSTVLLSAACLGGWAWIFITTLNILSE